MSEDSEWYLRLANNLGWVISILDLDVHALLKHVCVNFHELHSPTWLFTAMITWGSIELLLANLNMYEGGHLVKRSTNFAFKSGGQNM